MRLGILGGSFDPVHNAHLALAEACQQQAELDEVWFVPTAIQPLKLHGAHATDDQRIEMLRLAIEINPHEPRRPQAWSSFHADWSICTLEIDRGGLSYTVDTLRQLHIELPEAQLFFLIGADALRDVPHWKSPREIFRLATPLIARRAGQPDPDLAALASLCATENQPQLVNMPALDISSSEIRRRVAAGESIDTLVPPAVAAYIAEHNMYAARPTSHC